MHLIVDTFQLVLACVLCHSIFAYTHVASVLVLLQVNVNKF